MTATSTSQASSLLQVHSDEVAIYYGVLCTNKVSQFRFIRFLEPFGRVGAILPLAATLSFSIGTSFVEEQQNEHYVQRQNQIYRLRRYNLRTL